MRQLRFLLTDDDPDDRELFCEALAEVDGAVTCRLASDGKEAIELLEKGEDPLPDAIFLDINMPLVDGWKCLKWLKNEGRTRDIPVMIYSTSSNEKDKSIAQELGAVCLITKPADYEMLKRILKGVTERIRAMRPHEIPRMEELTPRGR